MNPLSVWNYYRNNCKKLMPVFMAVALSVFLLYIVQMLVLSGFKTEYLAFVRPQDYYSSIRPIGKLIDRKLIEAVKNHDSVGHVLPFIFNYTNITNSLGSDTGTKILSMRSEDIELMMKGLGLKLKEGRLPLPGSSEVMLHRLVAENKHMKTGDSIGNHVKKGEFYPGRHTVCGILEGDTIISFDSLETWQKAANVKDPLPYGMIIIPARGRETEMNAFLDSLPLGSIEVLTAMSASGRHNESVGNIGMILTIINIVVICIVSLCTGFLFYIFSLQRRAEFGILNAIGYTRQQIINRTVAEICGINAAGFIAGISLAIVSAVLLKLILFQSRGQLLILFDARYLVRVLCIPLFVTLFGTLPVWRMLEKLDPVTIIEGGA